MRCGAAILAMALAGASGCATEIARGAGDAGEVGAALARLRAGGPAPVNAAGAPMVYLAYRGSAGPAIGAFDLARGHRGVERARDGMIGERHRIVPGGQQESGFEGTRRQRERGDRQCYRHGQRRRDPRSGHGTRLLHATNFVSRACAGKMPARKISRFAATRSWPAPGFPKKRAPSAD